MPTAFEIWRLTHPYINHIVFGLIFGYIGYLIVRHYKKTNDAKIKYGVPILLTTTALIIFKYYESTLPLNTPTPIPGVFLNTVGDNLFLKILRQLITIASGGIVPLLYEKLIKKK